MKLLVRNNRRFLPFMLVILLVGGGIFYVLLQAIVRDETDEKLLVNEQRIIQSIEQGSAPLSLSPMVEIRILSGFNPDTTIYSDTTIFDPLEGEYDVFRQRCSHVTVLGETYELVTRSPIIDAKELIGTITGLTILLIFFFLISSYLLNRRATKQLWQPFYLVLSKLRSFNANQDQPIHLPETDIDEFKDLNHELLALMDNVRLEYRNLKDFTGNVSHELQTPLSIMRVKIEQLINTNPLSEGQNKLLELYEETVRMSKIIEELLLFSKIEGKQYKQEATVQLDQLIKTKLDQLSEIGLGINLHWVKELVPVRLDNVNAILVEVLLKNLIENAIRYTPPDGKIDVELSKDALVLKNNGEQPLAHQEKIFDRFYRDQNSASKSSGLGLAVAQKIAQMHHWKLTYTFNQGFHVFRIVF